MDIEWLIAGRTVFVIAVFFFFPGRVGSAVVLYHFINYGFVIRCPMKYVFPLIVVS